MRKRAKQTRKTKDENQVGHALVKMSTEEPEQAGVFFVESPASTISEYMSKIGRKGGKVGGKRRLETMTVEERKEIAAKAARARWKKAR